MLVVGRFDAYMPPAGGNWRVQRCCQTLKAYIICCFTNWVCLSLVGWVGLVHQDPGRPRRAGCHTAWFEAARLGPVGLADGPK